MASDLCHQHLGLPGTHIHIDINKVPKSLLMRQRSSNINLKPFCMLVYKRQPECVTGGCVNQLSDALVGQLAELHTSLQARSWVQQCVSQRSCTSAFQTSQRNQGSCYHRGRLVLHGTFSDWVWVIMPLSVQGKLIQYLCNLHSVCCQVLSQLGFYCLKRHHAQVSSYKRNHLNGAGLQFTSSACNQSKGLFFIAVAHFLCSFCVFNVFSIIPAYLIQSLYLNFET